MRSGLSSWLRDAAAIPAFLALVTTPSQAADIEVPIEAGATDQVVTITFENPTFRDVNNLGITVSSMPAWAENARLSQDVVASLGIAETADVTLSFDVKSDIGPDDTGEIELSFQLGEGELDRYILTIGPASIVIADAEETSDADTSQEHVLYLVRIELPETPSPGWHYEEGVPGATANLGSKSGTEELKDLRSVGFTQLPSQISLGQPFSLRAESRRQNIRAAGNCFSGGFARLRTSFRVDVKNEHVFDGGIDATPLDLGCDAPDMGFSIEQHGGYKLGVEFAVDIECVPIDRIPHPYGGSTTAGGTIVDYEYRCTSSMPDANTANPRDFIIRAPNTEQWVFHLGTGGALIANAYYSSDGPPLAARFDHAFEVENEVIAADSETPDDVTELESSSTSASADFGQSADDAGLQGVASDAMTLGGEGAAGSVIGPDGLGRANDQGATGGTVEPNAPGRANDPTVAGFIEEWLGVAEPPANATDGADFRFVEYGQIAGTSADGGVATPGRPDAVAGVSSIEYVWQVRTQLDSVDHCTVGEYVELRLADRSVEACRGRYRPRVPDLQGWRAADARDRLDRLRLETQIRIGKPAPSAELEGRVERQGIAPATDLDRGSAVELWVHTEFVGDLVTLGNWVGRQTSAAREALDAEGLEVLIRIGSPAPDARSSGAVEFQSPPPGMQVRAGSSVTLTAHTSYVDLVAVGDVRGRPVIDVKGELERQGFDVSVKPGSPAPDARRSGTVETQVPRPGMRVARGSTIRLTAHSRFVDTVAVPGVVGQTFAQASSTLSRSGFQVSRDGGSGASGDTVLSQLPGANVTAVRGSTVRVVLRGSSTPVPSPASGPFAELDCELGLQQMGITTAARQPGAKISPGDSRRPNHSAFCVYQYENAEFNVSVYWFEQTADPSGFVWGVSCKRGFQQTAGPPLRRIHWAGGGSGKAAVVRGTEYLDSGSGPVTTIGRDRFMVVADKLVAKVSPRAVSCSGAGGQRSDTIYGVWRYEAACNSGNYVGHLSIDRPKPGSPPGTFSTDGGGGTMKQFSFSNNTVSFERVLPGNFSDYWSGRLVDSETIVGDIRLKNRQKQCTLEMKLKERR